MLFTGYFQSPSVFLFSLFLFFPFVLFV